jgi:hypothetical protein
MVLVLLKWFYYLDILLREEWQEVFWGWYCGNWWNKISRCRKKITIGIGCALILMGLLGIIFFSRWRKRYVVYIHRGFGTFWISIRYWKFANLIKWFVQRTICRNLAGLAGCGSSISNIMNWLIPKNHNSFLYASIYYHHISSVDYGVNTIFNKRYNR